MNPISVQVLRGSDGLVNVIKVSKAGRQCVVQYDSVRNFTVTGSMPRHIAQVLAINAAYSPTPMDIVAQTIGSIDIDIAAQSVGNITVDLAAQSVGNITVELAANSLGNLTVDIAAASIAGNLNVNLAAQAANIDINIAAQAADVDVNITNASIAITGNVNAVVTGSVTVTSGAVTVTTTGGTNIVIDKLTQAAYTERRSTISNNGASASWGASTGATRQGKFFPRGCRGFINTIDVYCKDNAAAGGTITVYITPLPGMGAVASAAITIAAGGAAAWRSATFNRMWNYDSLFIFIISSTADMQAGYDADTPYDWVYSTDSGVTWTVGNRRWWYTIAMKGETVGDVPVSGIVNNIPIPNIGSEMAASAGTYNTNPAEATLKTVNGAGECDYFICSVEATANSHETIFRLYSDDVLALNIPFYYLNGVGITTTTPGVTLTQYAVGGACAAVSTLRVPFKRKLDVKIQNVLTGVNYWIYGKTNLIS